MDIEWNAERVKLLLLILGMTVVSGIVDSLGFVHATRVWQNDHIAWAEVGKSASWFAVGMSVNWLKVRYVNAWGVVSPEVQTMLWFSVTIVGIAMLSGAFFQWRTVDQMIALFVLFGVGWLLFRTNG